MQSDFIEIEIKGGTVGSVLNFWYFDFFKKETLKWFVNIVLECIKCTK